MIGNIAPIHPDVVDASTVENPQGLGEAKKPSAKGLREANGPSAKGLSVLVVDQVEETGEVLRAALGNRVRVLSADRARQGLQMACEHRPDLIVLDMELADQHRTCDQFRSQTAGGGEESVVMLGTARRHAPASGQEFVAKPYHYGALVRRIEELLKRAA